MRDAKLEEAINDLQEAMLLVGYQRRTCTAQLEDLTKIYGALNRARSALAERAHEFGERKEEP